MYNLEALLERAIEDGSAVTAPAPSIELTPEVFGKLLVAAWAAKKGRSEFPRREKVMAALLRNLPSAPAEILRVIHLDNDETGEIAEYSRYMAAAQMDGLIKRFNPDYIRVAVELDALTGDSICRILSRGLNNALGWIEDVVGQLSGSSGEAVNGKNRRASAA